MPAPKGNPTGQFGWYEALKTVNWKTLVVTLLLAVFSFLMSDVVPVLQSLGGYWSVVTTVLLVPAVTALVQLLRNNSGKT